MRLYGVVGAGGFGREVIPVAKEYLGMICNEPFKLVFIDDGISENKVNGYDVLTTDQFFSSTANEYYFNIAIGNGRTREKLAEVMLNKGAKPFKISASNAILLDSNEISDGVILCPFTTVTSNSKIGKYFQANIYSYVAHDCVIGDFVTFAPGVKCNGNVVIEDHAYIGTGAVIKQGTPTKPIVIGSGAVVGMGAVVTKSVAPGTTVVGNPAKPLRAGLGG
ncbi:acetyltransferase [Pseudomonas shirazica]|nr:acetyltransferase [Pseudomonas shirazica]